MNIEPGLPRIFGVDAQCVIVETRGGLFRVTRKGEMEGGTLAVLSDVLAALAAEVIDCYYDAEGVDEEDNGEETEEACPQADAQAG